MKVFVACVSSERQFVRGVASALNNMVLRPGDKRDSRYNTRGEIARTLLLNQFWDDPEFQDADDAILMLDLDMDHSPDMLEQLREHNLDMVTAHYFRRNKPPVSICNLVGDGKWPFPPMLDIPDDGLHEIAITGMGCVLIKRKVIASVWERMKDGENPFQTGPMPAYCGDYRNWGTDYSFFTRARECGYKLWLDASLESKHADTYWLDRELYEQLRAKQGMSDQLRAFWLARLELHGMEKGTIQARINFLTNERDKMNKDVEELKQKQIQLNSMIEQKERMLYGINTAIGENKAWLSGQVQIGKAKLIKKEETPVENDERNHKEFMEEQVELLDAPPT